MEIHTNKAPIFSIVTINLNNSEGLLKTITSVINQDFSMKEFIVIDGLSSDNSVSIASDFSNHIDYFLSENDQGIYDAMNKGILNCSGEYVIFLNSGDCFYNNSVLSNIFDIINNVSVADIIYGNFYSFDNELKFGELRISRPLNQLFKGMIFSHQSCFIRSSLLKMHPFDLNYPIAADYNMIYSLYLNNNYFINSNVCISTTNKDGISYLNPYTLIDYRKISFKFNKSIIVYIYHTFNIIILFIVNKVGNYFGPYPLLTYRNIKRKISLWM